MKRARLFGFEVDPLRMPEAVAEVLRWVAERDGKCRYVVTPNADHAVVYQENERLRAAYAGASLILVDGMPLLLAAKLLRRGVPERVPGSDLVPAIFTAASSCHCSAAANLDDGAAAGLGESGAAGISSSPLKGEGQLAVSLSNGGEGEEPAHKLIASAPSPSTGEGRGEGEEPASKDCLATHAMARPLRVYLLGAAPGGAERAAERIHATWPGVQVVGCYSPPLGFERDAAENDRILARIAAANCDLLVVGLGAPKQELWVAANRNRIAAPAALCVGATIDFLAGEKARAPVWMRRAGLEWLHRMASEPRRLARRYARDAVHLPRLLWRELRGRSINEPTQCTHHAPS